MDVLQLIALPFYLITTLVVFFVVNSRLQGLQHKFFSSILISLLVLSIVGLVVGIFGPQFFGWQTANLVIPAITLILLLNLAFFLIKSKILNPAFIFYKVVTFTSFIIVLGLSFTLLISLSDLFLVQLTQFRQPLIGVMLAIIAILVFQPVRLFLERTFGRIFFSNLPNFEKIQKELDLILLQDLKISMIAKLWLEKLIQSTKLTGAGIVLFEKRKPVFSKFINLQRPKTSEFAKFAKFEKSVLFQRENYARVIPLIFKGQGVGVLILGKKLKGVLFANELTNLEKIATKLTAPLIHAQAFDKIDKFNQNLTQTIEKSTHELAVANQKLSQIDRIKDEFVSLTSHELRTPMTAIKSYLWMALAGHAGKLSGKLARYLDLAYTSTERMIKLVNDLLNVTKIESGKIEFNPQGVNIVSLTRTVIREVEAETRRRGQTLSCEQQDLPLVLADWNRIHEVLVNLVGNSLKFTPAGGKIKISFQQANGFIETSVTDTGKGIADSDIPRLFRKFGLISGSLTATRETGGSGLGLYICKSLIDLHGGQIWAKSKLGAGSTFTFSLPVATEAQLAKSGIYDPEEKIRQVTGSFPGTAIPT